VQALPVLNVIGGISQQSSGPAGAPGASLVRAPGRRYTLVMAGVDDFFRRVPSCTAGEVKWLMKRSKTGQYALLDVRQPGEYEKGHFPGAMLIPLGELRGRPGELDPRKPTVVY
jgi:hypothetical protein